MSLSDVKHMHASSLLLYLITSIFYLDNNLVSFLNWRKQARLYVQPLLLFDPMKFCVYKYRVLNPCFQIY